MSLNKEGGENKMAEDLLLDQPLDTTEESTTADNLDTSTSVEGVEDSGNENVITIDEKEYTLDQIKQALKDSENKQKWQKANTQRAQQLAEMERQLQKARQLEEFLNQYPQVYSEIENIFKKYASQQTPTAQTQQQQITNNPLWEEVNRIKQTVDQIEIDKEMMKLQNDLNEIKNKPIYKKYFEEDPDLERKLVEYAYENDIMNLHTAFKDMMFDKLVTDMYQQGQDKTRQATLQRQNLNLPAGKRTKPMKVDVTQKSWNEIEELMMKDPRLAELG